MNIWDKLYEEALKVRNYKEFSPLVSGGQVSAAILTDKGNIYTGICIDMACGLGICAERNAALNMLTNGESRITKLICIDSNNEVGSPCCACREFLMQLDINSKEMEILLDFETKKTIKLEELVPDWWAYDRFKEDN